jgi:hypothetical protein
MKSTHHLFTIILLLLATLSACGPDLGDQNATEIINHVQVAEVDTKAVCPPSDKTPDKITLINDVDTPFVDKSRELKDFGTGFVVKEFFKTKDTLFNFMKLVYGTIDKDLQNYRAQHDLEDRAVFFLFKGGNVLRIIANQVLATLPPKAKALLKNTYDENFKRSDADFSIFIDESRLKGLNYDRVMSDLTELTYRAFDRIRHEFNDNPEFYFDYLQLNNKMAQRSLRTYFDQLSSLASIKDKDNENLFNAKFLQLQLLNKAAKRDLLCSYEGQYDYQYEFDQNDKRKIKGIPLTKSSNWIMNSINKTLEWTVENQPEKLIKFHLVRAKIQFEFTYSKDGKLYRKPIGAELIDVSFPHRDDFRLKTFLDNYERWITDYSLKLDSTGDSFTMKSETRLGLATDLYEVVFEQFPRPWEAAKYSKRINRLFFLSIVDMLDSFGLGSAEAKHYLNIVQKFILTPLAQLYPVTATSIKQADMIERNIARLAKQFQSMTTANMLWQGLSKLVKEELLKHPVASDAEDLKGLLKTINDNITVMLRLTQMPKESIDLSDVYNASMDSLF